MRILYIEVITTNSEEEAAGSDIDVYIRYGRTRAHNIITHFPGPRREARGNNFQIEI